MFVFGGVLFCNKVLSKFEIAEHKALRSIKLTLLDGRLRHTDICKYLSCDNTYKLHLSALFVDNNEVSTKVNLGEGCVCVVW